MATQLGPKGDMRSYGVLSVVFKTPKCTSHLGFSLVEHRDRLASFGVGMVEAMLRARGGSLVVIDNEEVDDDLVRDMTEILTCFCARLYGRRSAASRARRAVSVVQE